MGQSVAASVAPSSTVMVIPTAPPGGADDYLLRNLLHSHIQHLSLLNSDVAIWLGDAEARMSQAEEGTKKPCPNCGKWMISTGTGIVLTSYPEQYPQIWWCRCGHTEPAPTLHGMTEHERRLNQWEQANNDPG